MNIISYSMIEKHFYSLRCRAKSCIYIKCICSNQASWQGCQTYGPRAKSGPL